MYRTASRRSGLTAWLLAACILFLPHLQKAEGGEIPANAGSVRIMILSKTLRELKEGRTRRLTLEFPAGTYTAAGSGTSPVSQFTVTCDDDSFNFTGCSPEHDGTCVISNDTPGSYFTVRINNETRRYPMPLEVKYTGSTPRLIVTETIRNYSIDSAAAELGPCDASSREALYALAHAILARALAAKEGAKHDDANFCDLTCCQTYRGRTSYEFDDEVTASRNCGHRIFFGSSGGGIILTEKVFSTEVTPATGPCRDVIFSENLTLSMERWPSWEARISSDELNSILYAAINRRTSEIIYSPSAETMTLVTYEGEYRIAPESFRLIINRKKGWSFIKSNNYVVRIDNGSFIFKGSGLGHCAGMSIEGAVQLAKKGYTRYEILEHYYPWIKYDVPGNAPTLYYYSQVTFDLRTGKVMNLPGGDPFLERRIQFGSVSKLVTVLYLATERRDLFYNHRYTCRASHNDANLPDNCWDREGHGPMDIRSAIYNSCNLYFASLCEAIDMERYMLWVKNFSAATGIYIDMPAVQTKKEFAMLLAGLDFRLSTDVKSLMRLAMIVAETEPGDAAIIKFRKNIGSDEFAVIHDALRKTMTRGTGSGGGDSGDANNSFRQQMWGKTGTVISGTNNHCGYGIFIGGYNGCCIVAILRKGTGAQTADYSVRVLSADRDRFMTYR